MLIIEKYLQNKNRSVIRIVMLCASSPNLAVLDSYEIFNDVNIFRNYWVIQHITSQNLSLYVLFVIRFKRKVNLALFSKRSVYSELSRQKQWLSAFLHVQECYLAARPNQVPTSISPQVLLECILTTTCGCALKTFRDLSSPLGCNKLEQYMAVLPSRDFLVIKTFQFSFSGTIGPIFP